MTRVWLSIALAAGCVHARERTLTTAAHGHLIHNRQIFSPDGRHLYFDSRNDETQLAGSAFIGRVDITTGREEILYQIPGNSPAGPGVGAVTCNPCQPQLAFIHGLPDASEASPYAPHRRCGMTLIPGESEPRHLDARDTTPPFTPGALSGGTHAFHWSPDGTRLSFTYNDALVPIQPAPTDGRTVGVMTAGQPVHVAAPSSRAEFSGSAFSTIVVPVTPHPEPGSDEILRAFDEAWLDRQTLAFFGIVRTREGRNLTEVFLATLLPTGAAAPAQAAPGERPATPQAGIAIRRLTRTANRPFPGIQGPRHWVRPSPDGSQVAFLAKDHRGTVQIFSAATASGHLRQLSALDASVDTPFDWAPDARHLACAAGGRIHLIDSRTGQTRPLTDPFPAGQHPRYSVCFSPDGTRLATNRLLPHPQGGNFLQICLIEISR